MEPRASFSRLYSACFLVVTVCALHISVMLLFYLRNPGSESEPALPRHSADTSRSISALGTGTSTSGNVSTLGTLGTLSTSISNLGTSTPVPIHHIEATSKKALETCPETPPHLVGPLRVEFSDSVNLDEIRQDPRLSEGGRYTPRECVSPHKVALIIPYRNRENHLKYWLYYLHPILQRQQLDYGVYVIQQDGEDTFNRAKLLNVGYAEALKEYDYNCFVFSDVDLVPVDDRNIYRCFDQPRHLAVSMDKFGFRLPYNQYFGGVSAMSKEQFLKINGFPNNYWGWGGEDDDIYNRLTYRGMSVSRPDGVIGRCKMIQHNRDKMNEPNPQRFDRIARTRQTINTDGINTLTYTVVKTEKDKLFTKIIVDIGKP
ncbi:beta-1,4-galactosyltransferase 1-like [Astyanax mexicanus]|uniref:Beta-1,4-galactosyltransferase n=2 Tax=Astyanax mexicanus TaxID=7994 RepID=A0A8T2KSD4_ASTMX|nr:beta-1,4-galactosyltransferase 1-like [Astyanax mexicanus]